MRLLLRITSVINIIGGLFACMNAVNMFFGSNAITGNFIVGILSGIISIACAYVSFVAGAAGWHGAGGDKDRLGRALFFGKLNMLFAIINSIQILMKGFTMTNIQYTLSGLIIPLLFLLSAISVDRVENSR